MPISVITVDCDGCEARGFKPTRRDKMKRCWKCQGTGKRKSTIYETKKQKELRLLRESDEIA